MSDLIKREDAIKAVEECLKLLARPRYTVKTAIEAIPSVDIPHSDDWEKYSDKLWKNAYERGKADGAMIYGNEHNCIMTIFGECSYAETGCGDCAVVEKVRKALSADRPQDDEFKNFDRESLILLIEAQKERIGELLADRPQEWIPCSERLPSNFSEDETVLITTDVDGRKVMLLLAVDVERFYLKGYVSAWMPSPKPWEGADDETAND